MVDKRYLKTLGPDAEKALSLKQLDLSMKSLKLELGPGDKAAASD